VLTFAATMTFSHDDYAGKLLGFVRVDVGGRSFTVPIQALDFTRDTDDAAPSGGFFADSAGELGIFVDARLSEDQAREQIRLATDEAIRHLSRRYLS